MKYYFLIFLIYIVLAFFIGRLTYTPKVKRVYVLVTPTPVNKIDENKLFDLVQRWRYDNYLRPYTKSDFLCDIAKDRSNDDFSHDGFWSKYKGFGLAENLAISSFSARAYLDSWLSSPSHRKNLDAPYTHSCIKCDIQCVQIFGYR